MKLFRQNDKLNVEEVNEVVSLTKKILHLFYIAMVIAQDTDYIFLDEPLNNLDMKHSLQIMKILKSLANDFNKSIILVLHDINFASVHSDEIVAMRNGEILYHKESKELIKEEILKDVFDMDISIHDIKGKKICFYFD